MPVFTLKLETDLPTASFQTTRRPVCPCDNSRSSSGCRSRSPPAPAITVLPLPGLPERSVSRPQFFFRHIRTLSKRQRIADLGARIIEVGGEDLADAFLRAEEYSTRAGVYFLNDATDRDLPAGPATIGVEILRQLPEAQDDLHSDGRYGTCPRDRYRG